jgi:hypothetical protein
VRTTFSRKQLKSLSLKPTIVRISKSKQRSLMRASPQSILLTTATKKKEITAVKLIMEELASILNSWSWKTIMIEKLPKFKVLFLSPRDILRTVVVKTGVINRNNSKQKKQMHKIIMATMTLHLLHKRKCHSVTTRILSITK